MFRVSQKQEDFSTEKPNAHNNSLDELDIDDLYVKYKVSSFQHIVFKLLNKKILETSKNIGIP